MKDYTYPSIKLDFIDQQHHAIFEIIDDLSTGILQRTAKKQLKNNLLVLVVQCSEHFEQEEKLLRQYHYPDIDGHIQNHLDFRKKLDDLIKIYDDGRYELSVDTIHFLRDWFATHITRFDKKYEPYVQNKVHHTA